MANDNAPQLAAESVRPLIARRERFTASVYGPCGSGKTAVLAAIVHVADDLGLTFNEIAAFAPTPKAIRHLRSLIGRRWPDLHPDFDLFPQELSGVPMDAMRAHTALRGDDKRVRFDPITDAYLRILSRLNDLTASETDQRFLRSLKPRLQAAITLDYQSRLRGTPWPPNCNAYLDAVRDFVAIYKAEHRLLDRADLIHGDYYVSRQVRLLLLDDVDDNDRPVLPRYFPNASVIAASRHPQCADALIELERPRACDAGPAC